MNEQIEALYQPIGEELTLRINEEFEKAWIYVEMCADVGSINIFYKTEDNRYLFRLPGNLLFDLFNKMWHLSKETSKEPWLTATFYLDSEGEFSINYGYDDVFKSAAPLSKRRGEWIKKVLGDVKIDYSKA